MEKAPKTKRTLSQSRSLAELFGFLFIWTVFSWVIVSLQKLSLKFKSHIGFLLCFSRIHDEQCMKKSSTYARGDVGLSREDVEMVLGRMGMSSCQDGEKYNECMGIIDELVDMFVVEEPSLEEVKDAFNVFDEGRDGFIDALELQRALSKLGFSEGLAMEACEGMIAAYDENRDRRIDFNEFVKLMERSVC